MARYSSEKTLGKIIGYDCPSPNHGYVAFAFGGAVARDINLGIDLRGSTGGAVDCGGTHLVTPDLTFTPIQNPNPTPTKKTHNPTFVVEVAVEQSAADAVQKMFDYSGNPAIRGGLLVKIWYKPNGQSALLAVLFGRDANHVYDIRACISFGESAIHHKSLATLSNRWPQHFISTHMPCNALDPCVLQIPLKYFYDKGVNPHADRRTHFDLALWDLKSVIH